MKLISPFYYFYRFAVLPLTREWIEICFPAVPTMLRNVLPLTREWIEMLVNSLATTTEQGSPSYEGVD